MAKQFVLNLSSKKLTDEHFIVLSNGLNFVPSTKCNKLQLHKDFKKMERNLRLTNYFLENPGIKINDHPFKEKSNFTVPVFGDIMDYLPF